VLGTPPAFVLSQDQTLINSFETLNGAYFLVFKEHPCDTFGFELYKVPIGTCPQLALLNMSQRKIKAIPNIAFIFLKELLGLF
jgi:hypothetical protein